METFHHLGLPEAALDLVLIPEVAGLASLQFSARLLRHFLQALYYLFFAPERGAMGRRTVQPVDVCLDPKVREVGQGLLDAAVEVVFSFQQPNGGCLWVCDCVRV